METDELTRAVAQVVFVLWRNGQWYEVEAMGLKGQSDPTIPRTGDVIRGPDDFGFYVVDSVLYDYNNGFVYPPRVSIRCTPKAVHNETTPASGNAR